MADWDANLLFNKPADNSGHLVFGGDGGDDGPTGNDAIARVQGSFPAFSGTLQSQYVVDATAGLQGAFPEFTGTLSAEYVVHAIASLQGAFPDFTGQLRGVYDSGVTRSLGAATAARFEQAQHASVPYGSRFQTGKSTAHSLHDHFEPAAAFRADKLGAFESARNIGHITADRFERAIPLRHDPFFAFENATGLRCSITGRHQEAQPLRMSAQYAFQTAIWLAHLLGSRFENAELRTWQHSDSAQLAIPLRNNITVGRFQEAMVPPPGTRDDDNGGSEQEPCYKPDAKLVFCKQADGTADLLFECCECGQEGEEQPTFRIPVQSVYMQVNDLKAFLLPGLEPVVISEVSIGADDDGYCWSLSASGPEHLLEQLAPTGAEPARVRIDINGESFVFAVTSLARSRSVSSRKVTLQGESVTTLLAAPYWPVQTWLGESTSSAFQIALGALQFTDASLQWDIADWQVPAGAWSFQGSPLQAVIRVAESVGAVVRSHPVNEQLIIAPRYPVLPWEWGAATPTVAMPADVIVTDELQPQAGAAYNAVYVFGGAVGGVQGHVVRAGTPGDAVAQQIQDDLITDAAAARMRGSWALAASGNKLQHTISMPVLTVGTNPGILKPGQLLEVADLDGTWRGLVRGVRVTAALPKVRQQVTVERIA